MIFQLLSFIAPIRAMFACLLGQRTRQISSLLIDCLSIRSQTRYCLCAYLTRVPSETSLRPSTIIFASVKLILSLLQRLGLTIMMMQFEQNFVQTDISYWIMLALVGKEAVQLFCSGTPWLLKKWTGDQKCSFEFSEWTVQQASSHDLTEDVNLKSLKQETTDKQKKVPEI